MKLIDAENLKRFFDIKGAKFYSESIVKTIDRMPNIPHWTFSRDRRPKDGEPCLICSQYADGEIYVVEDVYYLDSKLKAYFGSSYEVMTYEEEEVIAWMPLPEPPQLLDVFRHGAR